MQNITFSWIPLNPEQWELETNAGVKDFTGKATYTFSRGNTCLIKELRTKDFLDAHELSQFIQQVYEAGVREGRDTVTFQLEALARQIQYETQQKRFY